MGFPVLETLSQSKGIHKMFGSVCKYGSANTEGGFYRSLAHDGKCLAAITYTVTKQAFHSCDVQQNHVYQNRLVCDEGKIAGF